MLKLLSACVLTCLISGPLSAFTLISNFGKVAHWRNDQVDFYFHDSVPTQYRDALRNSFAAWTNVPGLGLSVTEVGSTSQAAVDGDDKNVITWTTSGWRNLSFRPPAGALAVTVLSFNSSDGSLSDADIYFNDEYFDWGNLNGGEFLIDVENIGTHEVGHLMGLDHSSEDPFEEDAELLDATMYYAAAYGEIERRDLAASDELGIRALYSTENRSTPRISSVLSLGGGFGARKYRISGENFGDLTSFVITNDSSSVYDEVVRYRRILSSTEAEVTVELAGFSDGSARLVAVNGPNHRSDYRVSIQSSSLQADSAGGGGCSLQPRPIQKFSWVTFYFCFLATLSLMLARRRFRTS